MAHSDFVHLHNHSQFSLLDAASKIPQLIKRAVELRFPALAVTDHGNLFAAIAFYEEAMKQGIKPIIGMEAYIAPKSRLDKSAHGIKEASHHITLLCKNEEGYRNLLKLTTASYLEGFYYRPRIDKELLSKHREGLIALSGCLKGEVPYYTWNDQLDQAKKALAEYVDLFGKDDFYLELANHGIDAQRKLFEHYPALAKEFGVKLVATNDCHYIHQADAAYHDALICIGTGSLVSDEDRMRYYGDQFYLKSTKEMQELFKDFPDALRNTIEIAERCTVELDLTKTYLPMFTPPGEKKQEDYLEEICFEFLTSKWGGTIPREYEERLRHELHVIRKMGFSGYFLVVWDFVRYARERQIPVGPGRGSAAGSLVAYALGITSLDPIRFGLIFERFLNPERVSMPDIDIDFCFERRDEVIEYVRKKYGEESVAHIVTFGTMAARAVIRDVGRVMGMSYQEVDKLAKLVPNELEITIDRALKTEPRLRDLAKSDERVSQLIETSKALEGLSRHASTHAAGIVISDGPLFERCPLFKTNGQITTQYDMTAVEKIGLLKMDFLGLRTLTVIDKACKLIKRQRGVDIQIDRIPLDDEPTYHMLGTAESMGVFQLESAGMRDLLKKMKPTRFGDLVALLALFRPGPLGSGMVDDFIRRMHDASLSQYDHPALEPILKETYGIILYQEQVMHIVSDLAGFSMAKADSLRRAIGKKVPEIMEREKKSFLEGAHKKKIDVRIAERIWNLIEYFSGYGFNKSHSTAYAFISYQTAYLKANFPNEFMAALLTSEKDNTDKIVRYIEECKRLNIPIHPPSVNESDSEFSCVGNTVRFGLSAVKNVGSGAVESVLESRRRGGKFKSLQDFTERVDLRLCNRKVLESLIKCGALDSFGLKRSQMVSMIDHLLTLSSKIQHDRERGQLSLLDHLEETSALSDSSILVLEIEEWPEHELLAYEREMLGFYVSAHPLAKFEKILRTFASVTTSHLSELRDQTELTIGGIIHSTKEIVTKRGDRMAFIGLEDLDGRCEVVVFPEVFKSSIDLLQKDKCVYIRGKANVREDIPKVIAEEIIPLEEVKKKKVKVISIDLLTAGLDLTTLEKLKEILTSYPGATPVHLHFRDSHGRKTVLHSGDQFSVESDDPLFEKLETLLGAEAIKIMC
ncbi:MAG: DNA polymerase III subunit alpha [Omnitrophica bacterium RIFCSPLOWO2_01_FULL_50_24]|nr:MAG: DNA polymerase III subunit alpha [Omnitrophica bacterium RIFCSPLOWO2_01_FULL_50_24]